LCEDGYDGILGGHGGLGMVTPAS